MSYPRWRIITLGNTIPDGGNGPGRAHCTSTLIETETRRVLVDPGSPPGGGFPEALRRRTGYAPEDIDTVFLTHFHPNHRDGLSHFPKAAWMMSRVEIRWWSQREGTADEEQHILARMTPIEENPVSGLEILPTPGHTHGSTSLMFETREGIVIAAGDAAPTFDHFDLREPGNHCEDTAEARKSIGRIAKMADLVIPGHDNYFVV